MFKKIGSSLADTATGIFEDIGDQIGEIGGGLKNIFGNQASETSAENDNGDLIFPIELSNEQVKLVHQCVTEELQSDETVFKPC